MERNFMCIAVLSALTDTVGSASASSIRTSINERSHHVDATHDWNENNLEIGIEYQFDSNSRCKTAAMSKCSRDCNDKMSYAVSGRFQWRLVDSQR